MPEIQPPAGIPPAEVEITDELVGRLLATQHPDLASLELRHHGNGWDNTTYRLGADLAVRLPRRQVGVGLILKEQRWLPEISTFMPTRVPAPIRIGVAGEGYPWPWSVVPWIAGLDAVERPLPAETAGEVGAIVHGLHRPGPPDAPHNEFRGVPLLGREPSVEPRLRRISFSGIGVSRETVVEAWRRSSAVEVDAPDVWIHGDLHPRNVIVASGRLSAVVDWGDLCVGDPATDLAAAWLLFEPEAHRGFRGGYGPISDASWERARGWAISFAVLLIDSGSGHDEAWAEVGRRVLERACS